MQPYPVTIVLLALLLGGCSSLSSRIERNREVYNTYPLEVREMIAAGEVGLGFTAEQVTIVLGKPDRTYTRTTPDGTSEVWAYRAKRPRFSIGLGVSSGGGSTRMGTGVGVSTGEPHDDEHTRVVLTHGHVTAIEQTR